jgi:DNA-binding NarL/FixJ family response regulator
VRVAIADDSGLIRDGLARALEAADIDVCGAVGDADALLALVAEARPDVAIVDIRMPPTFTDEGLRAAAAILDAHDGVGVLVLSQQLDAAHALRLLDGRTARCGYLLKDRVTALDELVGAVRRVAAGELVVDREVVDALVARRRVGDPLAELTAKEREVLELMAEGLTDRGIAQRLWLSERTVETHVRHVLRKLDLAVDEARNRRVQAVLAYLRR